MTTNLREVTGTLTSDELKEVKLQINFMCNVREAIRSLKLGKIVGYYDSDDNEIIINSIDVLEEADKNGYEFFVRRYFM